MMSTSHAGQLPAEQMPPLDPALFNVPSAPMNLLPPTQAENSAARNTTLTSITESAEEAIEDDVEAATGPEAPRGRNNHPAASRNKSYPAPRGRPKGKATGAHRGVGMSKRDVEEPVFKWRPGLKMKQITPDMSDDEREAVEEWNIKYSRAKAEHTRKQNRESAQRSRARKISELHNTKDKVGQLEALNEYLNQKAQQLDMTVRKLSDEKMGHLQTIAHLSSMNENLRERISLLEQQVHGRTIHSPNNSLTMFANQPQTPVPAPNILQDRNPAPAQTPQASTSAAPVQQGNDDPATGDDMNADLFPDFFNMPADDSIMRSIKDMEQGFEDNSLDLMQLSGDSLSPHYGHQDPGMDFSHNQAP